MQNKPATATQATAGLTSLSLAEPVVSTSAALGPSVLLYAGLLDNILEQCDFPTLLTMRATCKTWRPLIDLLHKKRLTALLSHYFERPLEFSIFMRSLDGAVSGSSILELLFPTDSIACRPLTDLDIFFQVEHEEVATAFLLGQGYKQVVAGEGLAGGDGDAQEEGVAEEEVDPDLYLMAGLHVVKFQRDGKKVDLVLCEEAPINSITKHFYGTHVLNWWSQGRLHCSHPNFTFQKKVGILRNEERAEALMQEKWEKYGFDTIPGCTCVIQFMADHDVSCSITLEL